MRPCMNHVRSFLIHRPVGIHETHGLMKTHYSRYSSPGITVLIFIGTNHESRYQWINDEYDPGINGTTVLMDGIPNNGLMMRK